MSDTYSVIYSPKALEDLRGIFMYIKFKLKNPTAAENQVKRIRNEVRLLDFMPARFVLADWEPWKSMGVHKISIDKYVIFYTVDENEKTVTIVRIVYGGRDLKNILDSE